MAKTLRKNIAKKVFLTSIFFNNDCTKKVWELVETATGSGYSVYSVLSNYFINILFQSF